MLPCYRCFCCCCCYWWSKTTPTFYDFVYKFHFFHWPKIKIKIQWIFCMSIHNNESIDQSINQSFRLQSKLQVFFLCTQYREFSIIYENVYNLPMMFVMNVWFLYVFFPVHVCIYVDVNQSINQSNDDDEYNTAKMMFFFYILNDKKTATKSCE